MTLDEIRAVVGDNVLDAALGRLGAKTAAAAEKYRAAGYRVICQN